MRTRSQIHMLASKFSTKDRLYRGFGFISFPCFFVKYLWQQEVHHPLPDRQAAMSAKLSSIKGDDYNQGRNGNISFGASGHSRACLVVVVVVVQYLLLSGYCWWLAYDTTIIHHHSHLHTYMHVPSSFLSIKFINLLAQICLLVKTSTKDWVISNGWGAEWWVVVVKGHLVPCLD